MKSNIGDAGYAEFTIVSDMSFTIISLSYVADSQWTYRDKQTQYNILLSLSWRW